MQKTPLILTLFISTLFYNSSCNRQTSSDEKNNLKPKEIIPEITVDDPFKNQPNELCTIIRFLSVYEYAPQIEVKENEMSKYPNKYCLLDICLLDPENSNGVINIGDDSTSINTTYQLIKIFDTQEEAKLYADQYRISDVVYE